MMEIWKLVVLIKIVKKLMTVLIDSKLVQMKMQIMCLLRHRLGLKDDCLL